MPSPKSVPPPIAAKSTETAAKDDQHQHRRRLIGPLPSQILARMNKPKKGKARATNADDAGEHAAIREVIHNVAYQFFLKNGGSEEEWDESEAVGVREEMYKRWRESGWGQALRRREHTEADKRCVGTSFDVGTFLGVDILDTSSHRSAPASASTLQQAGPSARTETFVTAPSHVSGEQQTGITHGTPSAPRESTRHMDSTEALHIFATTSGVESQSAADSSTALIKPAPDDLLNGPRSEMAPRRDVMNIEPSTPRSGNLQKGKKTVRYSSPIVDSEEAPAPPREVLSRTGEAVEHTSAGATQHADAETETPWGEVVMRDRMLVKFSHSESGSLPSNFDEWGNRTTNHLYNEKWNEYIVVWRKERLELYRGHGLPGKDWITGHKKLIFVIPLSSSSTRLSVYSFVDMTFCLICPPSLVRHHSKRRWFHNRKRGLDILIFKVKSRSRAVDWIWKLWKHLGGELPPILEIQSPALNTRIKVSVPDVEGSDIASAYRVFTSDNIVRLCQDRLQRVPEYNTLIGDAIARGAELALAWCSAANLDWVWQVDDIRGEPRPWAVLCGLALSQGGKPARLEISVKEHFPTHLHLKDGTRMDEPPAVEGYLERVRPASKFKQVIYLTTHDGYLFTLPQVQAHHPAPPGFVPPNSEAETLRQDEIRRGTQQILNASAIMDLRSVVAVRRAFQLIPHYEESLPAISTPNWEDTDIFWEAVQRIDSDDSDPGGDVGLAQVQDKATLHMRRSFELLLVTGNIVRFEAYSCQYAMEWIVRLRLLVSYWRKRHQVDARREMDLAHLSTGRPRITPLTPVYAVHDAPPEGVPDPRSSLSELSSFFNWCVLDGCRPLLKCGKLYARKGLRGQYQHTQLVLVSGNLIQYHITSNKMLHHRRQRMISLLDACVCSGYLTAQYLPEGQYDPDAPHVARRYQDGLETDDGPEDTLFMIWYRSAENEAFDSTATYDDTDVPSLSMKRKVSIFRTRSRLERDNWVWAINVEIEKVVRATREREERIRETGRIMATRPGQ